MANHGYIEVSVKKIRVRVREEHVMTRFVKVPVESTVFNL